MNGEFLRGEIYWFRGDDGIGSEIASKRPGVIVSSDRGNQTSSLVNICYLSSAEGHGVINVRCFPRGYGKASYVKCNQVFTYDKKRALEYMGKLTDFELAAVDRGITVALGLQDVDMDVSDEVSRLEEELEKVKSEKEDELLSLKVELELHKRMYEKAMDLLVNRNIEKDMTPAIVPETVIQEESPKKYEVEKKPKIVVEEKPEPKVDINNCTEKDLVKAGFNAEVAKNVVMLQPYNNVDELKEVPGVTATWFRVVKNRLTCTVVSEKVNINTASAKEIHEKTGLPICTAYSITGTRKRNGLYKKLEELKNVDRFSQYHWDNYASKFEV